MVEKAIALQGTLNPEHSETEKQVCVCSERYPAQKSQNKIAY